jgi:hypothetical protein
VRAVVVGEGSRGSRRHTASNSSPTLTTYPKDDTLRFTEEWASERSVETAAVAESLRHFGGYCNYAVLANVVPESIF